MTEVDSVIDHLFRHRAGQMVATLTRVFGPEHLPLAEEMVQDALIAAMQQWSFHGIPENPAGWLYRVARNRALDHLRRAATFQSREAEIAAALREREPDDDGVAFSRELRDDTLQMMLMCGHPAIPEPSRIALMLKLVGGFGVDEIARALLAEPATVAQRIVRAKRLIVEERIPIEMPSPEALPARLESLLQVLYLIFNEGYAAHTGEELVRHDLVLEAIRLAREVAAHPATTSPAAHALLALMLLQAARLPARLDVSGELALLADQDRSLWDRSMIAEGLRQLDASAAGNEISSYHLEAGIAAAHCIAPSFEETDWHQIVALYDDLCALRPSPVAALNRAVAIAMADGIDSGIEEVERIAGEPALRDYLPLLAVLGELSLRAGQRAEAAMHFTRALELPASMPEKRFLLRKLESCRG